MDEHFLKSLASDRNPDEILLAATKASLASLPPEVEDAAYRCVILHWFNEELLQAVLGPERITHLESRYTGSQKISPKDMVHRLCALPFVEEFPGRGHNFHDLTRQLLLKYLWQDEREFYRQMSLKAVQYFGKALEGPGEAAWEEVVEWTYHLLMVDEDLALQHIQSILNDLVSQGHVGHCHALLEGAEEHVQAGRLSPENLPLVRFWRASLAYAGYDLKEAERLAKELIDATDEAVEPYLKTSAIGLLADCMRLTGRYDEAYAAYKDALNRHKQLEDMEEATKDLVNLADVCIQKDLLPKAQEHLNDALELYVPGLAVSLTPGEESEVSIRPMFDELSSLPTTVKIHEPDCWIRLGTIKEWLGGDEEGDEEAEASLEGGEDTEIGPSDVILYGIEMEAEKESGASPDSEGVLKVCLTGVTQTLANIWHRLGMTHSIFGNYDQAAACCRLSGLIFHDLGDTAGLQEVLGMLSRLGAAKGDLEMMQLGANSSFLLESARERNDRRTELGILLGLSEAHLGQSDYRQSREKYNEALSLARSIGDIVGEATALDGLARLDWIGGNLDSAATLFEEALELYRRVGHREGQARTLSAMGDFELDRFDPKLAADYYEASLELYHDLHIPSGEIEALKGLGLVAQDRRRYDEAIDYFQRAATIGKKLRMPKVEAECLSCLADTYSIRGNHSRAREIYQRALTINRQLGDRRDEANTLFLLGNMAVAERKFEEAGRFFREAREIFASLKQPEEELRILFGELSILWEGQDHEARIGKAKEALDLAISLENRSQEARARMELGLAYTDAGRHDEAIALLEEVIRLTPQDAVAVLNFGHALYEAGDYERSIEFSQKAFDMDQTQNYALRNIGHAYLALGQPEKAESRYRQAIDQAHEGEDFTQSIETIKRLLERRPDTPRGAELLALFEEAQAKLDADNSAD